MLSRSTESPSPEVANDSDVLIRQGLPSRDHFIGQWSVVRGLPFVGLGGILGRQGGDIELERQLPKETRDQDRVSSVLDNLVYSHAAKVIIGSIVRG